MAMLEWKVGPAMAQHSGLLCQFQHGNHWPGADSGSAAQLAARGPVNSRTPGRGGLGSHWPGNRSRTGECWAGRCLERPHS